ncbi:hypothetical protein PV755_33925 [Streptomyces caniscabiei]|uniref:Uncharacterized protein n=1 Tax=Streptomyces caniscabiei TaxID=2746961 RepID=A0A927QPY7_9ACTN|nr:hypothetical protein [Streptomyces caniscabiei]MBD9728129.1 hypothetical protein [Streptomyces caniscabiei]MDX3513851.1 hypothetical protein [Streptomyces caniscabiei]MDX3722853.1 hypothetical protein [Streptomyces caniscabiei]WEO23617.1 hypothetical protein IHE65_10800 [Streptomyces caniscabiei]
MSATSSTSSTSASAGRDTVRALSRRWPTVLALALTVPGLVLGASADPGPAESAATVNGYAEFLPLLPLLYVVIHQVGNPGATWPVLAAGASFAFALQALDLVSPAGVLVGTSLAVLLWGALRGALRGGGRQAGRDAAEEATGGTPPHGPTALGTQALGARASGTLVFGVQALGAVVFGALAVTGLVLDADLGRYVIAAGWFCHGVWDFAHLRLRRLRGVVAPTFAEWCAVVDVMVAVELLFLV